jgi:hypothetical protein
MEKFEQYMAAFDGATDWDAVAGLFDETFHDDAVFVTADGEMSKQQWAEMSKGLREKGAVISGFQITKTDGDTIYYEVTVTPGGEKPLELKAKGTVKDGQVWRVEPLDPSKYSDLVQRSS